MKYVNWTRKKDLIEELKLQKIDFNLKNAKCGLPIMYDDEGIYIDSGEGNSIVIGSTGCGKTQVITLPMLRLAASAHESVVVIDSRKELFETTSEYFKTNGYSIIRLNFDDFSDCNKWNPFEQLKNVFDLGMLDKLQEIIEEFCYYLFYSNADKDADPFWNNSAINYFTGIILYCLKNNVELSFDSILSINLEIQSDPKKFMDSVEKNSDIYLNLVGILNAPPETMGSILSVFNQKLKMFFSRKLMQKNMVKSDFDLNKISAEKTIIYIHPGSSLTSRSLISLFISQIYYSTEMNKEKNKLNIILDDFNWINPIKNFGDKLDVSRGLKLNFTILIKGFSTLKNAYGNQEADIIKYGMANILYLLSNELDTLEEIKQMCSSYTSNNTLDSLVTIEELKTMKYFEAILISRRGIKSKTDLLPFYKWN